jgi:hypothetical protein
MEVFEELNIDTHFYANRVREADEILPWDFINCGVTKEFLREEYDKAMEEVTTTDCRHKCYNCGINKEILGGACPHVQNN